MWISDTNRDDWVELAQATGIIQSRFVCSTSDAERLLTETAEQARLDLLSLAERLLEPSTREAALAAVAVVLRDTKPASSR